MWVEKTYGKLQFPTSAWYQTYVRFGVQFASVLCTRPLDKEYTSNLEAVQPITYM